MEIIQTTKKSKGFTLIETVVVIFLFSSLGLISTNILGTILKTTTKASLDKELKQNGDYAINFMERSIRNAKKVNPCNTSSSTLTLENQNGSITVFECLNQDSVAKIASTSGTVVNSLTSSSVTVGSVGGNCSTSSLIFTCSNQTPQSVGISFTLKQSRIGGRAEEQSSAFFQSTVGLRNY